MKNYTNIGVQVPRVYLPRRGIDPSKWAVIACDQFTSEPEYWAKVEQFVGEAPSTLDLVLPEVYLERPDVEERIQRIQQNMRDYMAQGLLIPYDGIVYVERQVGAKVRKGLVLALDLEQYDFTKGSHSLIRATEGTIIERLPPRMRIREGAELELPHILVLIDDPLGTVIEPLGKTKAHLKKLYDFDLMAGSGHLNGYLVDDPVSETSIVNALEQLAKPELFAAKYNIDIDRPVLLFAMGDGNHSLATAKAIWEKHKAQVGMDHPLRYAMVEIENVHDEGLEFAPIHRVLFGLKRDIVPAMQEYFGEGFSISSCASRRQMEDLVKHASGVVHTIGVISAQGYSLVKIKKPSSNLPVGTLQPFLDDFVKSGSAEKIDYIHGEDIVYQLGQVPGNISFYLPAMSKSDLFKTVILDGALPRKTFSMGEAYEKRFYMECRKIS